MCSKDGCDAVVKGSEQFEEDGGPTWIPCGNILYFVEVLVSQKESCKKAVDSGRILPLHSLRIIVRLRLRLV